MSTLNVVVTYVLQESVAVPPAGTNNRVISRKIHVVAGAMLVTITYDDYIKLATACPSDEVSLAYS